MTRLLSSLVPALAALLFAGCASQQAAAVEPLPFHVAVIPFDATAGSTDLAGDKTTTDVDDSGFRIDLDQRDVSSTLVEKLDGQSFARATLLELPPGGLQAFEALPEAERDAWWVDAAVADGADLVLDCRLTYGTEIGSERNEKFWLNLPLFIFGGPFCYFVDDRTYYAEAELQGDLYDLSPIRAQRTDLAERGARLVSLTARFDDVAMDFIDRAGSLGASYALSFVVPAGFLSGESDAVVGGLEDSVVDQLCTDLASRFTDRKNDVLRAGRIVGFYLDPDELAVRRTEDGEVEIRGPVYLARGGVAHRMNAWRISAGGESWAGHLDEPDEEPGRFVYALDRTLPVPAGVDALRLELEDGSRDRNVRTWTVPIAGESPAK